MTVMIESNQPSKLNHSFIATGMLDISSRLRILLYRFKTTRSLSQQLLDVSLAIDVLLRSVILLNAHHDRCETLQIGPPVDCIFQITPIRGSIRRLQVLKRK